VRLTRTIAIPSRMCSDSAGHVTIRTPSAWGWYWWTAEGNLPNFAKLSRARRTARALSHGPGA
jgi:hypothetical protein